MFGFFYVNLNLKSHHDSQINVTEQKAHLWNVVEYKVTQNGNTQVGYKYLKIVRKYNTWVNVLSYCPPLYACI